jgi:protein TonB
VVHGAAFLLVLEAAPAPLGGGAVEVAIGEIGFAPLPEVGDSEDLPSPASPAVDASTEDRIEEIPIGDVVPAEGEPEAIEPVDVTALDLEPPAPLGAEESLDAPSADVPLRSRRPQASAPDIAVAAPRAAAAAPARPAAPARRAAGGARGLPVVVHRVEPDYPAALRAARVAGRVSLHVLVGTKGEVREVRVASSSGHAAFDDSALRALYAWRFVPRTEAFWVQVPVRFSPS